MSSSILEAQAGQQDGSGSIAGDALAWLSPAPQEGAGAQLHSLAIKLGLLAEEVEHPVLLRSRPAGLAGGEEAVCLVDAFQGTTLKAYLEHHPAVPAEEAFAILKQLAGALDALSSAGFVHLCLRPSVILLAEPLQVRLFDHVLAYAKLSPEELLPAAGALPPEYFAGSPLTPASHAFALARIAYRLLFAGEAFARPSLAEQIFALVHALWNEAPVGVAIKPVFDRAFSRDPAARFQTCEAFVSELQTAWRAAASAPTRLVDTMGSTLPLSGSMASGPRSNWLAGVLRSRYLLAGSWTTALVAAVVAVGSAESSHRIQADLTRITTVLQQHAAVVDSGPNAASVGLINGRMSICNGSGSAVDISSLSTLAWDSGGQQLQAFTSPASMVWHAPPNAKTPIALSAPDGTVLWDGSAAFYAMVVGYEGKRYLAGGPWSQATHGCIGIDTNSVPR